MRKTLLAAFATVVTVCGLTFAAAPAQASTGGTVDGDLHPDVGLIAFYDGDGRWRCSATLVSPTVVITAAHCTLGTLGKTLVTFDTYLDDAPPSFLPEAADPAAGYTAAELAAAGYHSGTAYTHPEYSDFTDLKNWNDVGVIVLDEPLASHDTAGYAPIAETGTLDLIAPSDYKETIFTAVGYGTEVRQDGVDNRKPVPQSYPIVRRYVEMPAQKITPQILQTNGNENDPWGTGGTCFGDSGGPVYLDGELVAVTSYGYTSNCRYLDGYQRVDIPVVEAWLDGFGL
ncbi:trypsin-like serine protease [Agromyces sp. H66]|uniref:trypsin-like serine protease n=1 Tax=Agromyces sp. H66 TaxID=2529859 RepID=UPI0010AAF771|nr:trypsin-like serine protease [Agromyces sp. H66]